MLVQTPQPYLERKLNGGAIVRKGNKFGRRSIRTCQRKNFVAKVEDIWDPLLHELEVRVVSLDGQSKVDSVMQCMKKGEKKVVPGTTYYKRGVRNATSELSLWVLLSFHGGWSTFDGVTCDLNDSKLVLPFGK